MKVERQRAIALILRRRDVASQAELARLLRARGLRVTQATLSRDLEDLGAFKARLPDGRAAYRLPEEPPADGERVRRILAEFVTDIEASGNMVVVKTPPGSANTVGRALDAVPPAGVLGTLAGDDTLLIVCREGVRGRTVAAALRRLAGGPWAAAERSSAGREGSS